MHTSMFELDWRVGLVIGGPVVIKRDDRVDTAVSDTAVGKVIRNLENLLFHSLFTLSNAVLFLLAHCTPFQLLVK